MRINFENIEIVKRPRGKVILVACDSLYFERFSDNLICSFVAHVKNFNFLHFHVISPTSTVLHKLLHNENSVVTFSFEDPTCTKEINKKQTLLSIFFDNIPNKIRHMLVAEQERNNALRSFVFLKLMQMGVPAKIFLRPKWLNNSKSRVYYACRRFMMPSCFFDEISAVLIIDADSYFNSDIELNEGASSIDAFAICRSKSWSKFLAGFLYVKINDNGLKFLNKLKNDLVMHFSDGIIYWGIDQVLLDQCEKVGLLSCFSKIDVGFKKNSSASFISLKGDIKWQS